MTKYKEQYHAEPELWGRVVECMGSNNALDKRLYRARDKAQNDKDVFKDVINSSSYILALKGNKVPNDWKGETELKVEKSEDQHPANELDTMKENPD